MSLKRSASEAPKPCPWRNSSPKLWPGEFSATLSGDIARELLAQVQIDREPLRRLIDKVGKVSPDLYDALGWMAERDSRFKLRHDDPAGIGAFEASYRCIVNFDSVFLRIAHFRSERPNLKWRAP
jgi:hypothetical protein